MAEDKDAKTNMHYIPDLNAFYDPSTNTYKDMHGYPFIPTEKAQQTALSEDSLFTGKTTAYLVFAAAAIAGYYYMMQAKIDQNSAQIEMMKLDINNKLDVLSNKNATNEKRLDKITDSLETQTDLLRTMQNTINNILRDNRTNGNNSRER